MAKVKVADQSADLSAPQYYINREVSWLGFNERVLHEALDPRTPLLERLKLLAIYSDNLDEFFMVRISGVMDQAEAGVHPATPDQLTPMKQLEIMRSHLIEKVALQHQTFERELRPALTKHGVYLQNYRDLAKEQIFFLKDYFEKRIFPVLTPLSVDPSHPFPRMSNLSLNLAVKVADPDTGVERFARVKVPSSLPRFVGMPEPLCTHKGKSCVWIGVPLEQVIAENLSYLFPGMTIVSHHLFRITRDADFPVLEDEADDLLLAIAKEISKRRLEGFVCRVEVESAMPADLQEGLMRELKVGSDRIYEINGLLNLKDLFFFLSLPLPELKDKPWTPLIPPRLKPVVMLDDDGNSNYSEHPPNFFAALRDGDILVHHPYESFRTSVQEFITQAANDPKVLTIKITLYRTSGDSPIVKALITAAENRKQVVALVELKARFDEANNIEWAKKLEDAGVHVVYGIVGLKTHTKTTLVVREEGDNIRRYVHIGTGNYNPKTSKLYTDLGLFSGQEELGADLSDLFNFLTGYSRQKAYRKLLVAPLALRDRMEALIRREIDHAQSGGQGKIVAKMNSLVDGRIIRLLYEASQAGVEIDLIVRGICCLRPGMPGVSENIRVISVIGRFLEHSRIFCFHNSGQPEYFIGSADWMTRNLDRRVEAVVPIDDPKLVKELQNILDVLQADNRQAWEMAADGTFTQRRPVDEEERGTHATLMAYALKRDSTT
ncbi:MULTISPECIES: polyphosphate kinase 1 [Cyanophyceae]|uniref:polyphosphate kinase 1 n=1 Tax=Cyanophyceae TaxID=3028117 RepID=UPI001686C0F0|nr:MULTISPECIES: polyphosphate kinase 1 [Cyanophyceae]MBD1915542.1 polyphosphate kinase 1 [Phormidium sp. FACHB-77]MBD2031852.1 polyphosphate kinase 1 [Phormidium sp. FACHB-322]MBD2050602.1 polyphosphate kinase 1 [Leptolyngbya sp. FACHB-60]